MGTVNAIRPRLHRLKILVVEDNLDGLHTLVYLLRDMGHEVQFAINGFAAVEVARAFKPQIILLDMLLPGMNGDIVVQQLRHEEDFAQTRFIAFSAQDDQRTRALQAGCIAFHRKPVTPAEWAHILEGNTPPKAA